MFKINCPICCKQNFTANENNMINSFHKCKDYNFFITYDLNKDVIKSLSIQIDGIFIVFKDKEFMVVDGKKKINIDNEFDFKFDDLNQIIKKMCSFKRKYCLCLNL